MLCSTTSLQLYHHLYLYSLYIPTSLCSLILMRSRGVPDDEEIGGCSWSYLGVSTSGHPVSQHAHHVLADDYRNAVIYIQWALTVCIMMLITSINTIMSTRMQEITGCEWYHGIQDPGSQDHEMWGSAHIMVLWRNRECT